MSFSRSRVSSYVFPITRFFIFLVTPRVPRNLSRFLALPVPSSWIYETLNKHTSYFYTSPLDITLLSKQPASDSIHHSRSQLCSTSGSLARCSFDLPFTPADAPLPARPYVNLFSAPDLMPLRNAKTAQSQSWPTIAPPALQRSPQQPLAVMGLSSPREKIKSEKLNLSIEASTPSLPRHCTNSLCRTRSPSSQGSRNRPVPEGAIR